VEPWAYFPTPREQHSCPALTLESQNAAGICGEGGLAQAAWVVGHPANIRVAERDGRYRVTQVFPGAWEDSWPWHPIPVLNKSVAAT
jgi:hypothetical protein